MTEAGLVVEGLRVTLGGREILHGVDFAVAPGRVVGLVGESGSGKTTIARAVAGFVSSRGSIRLDGTELGGDRRHRTVRRSIQLVPQDPYTTLNPRLRIGRVLEELLGLHRLPPGGGRTARRARAVALMEQVGLDAAALQRRPSQFSGGQRQRIALARALAVEPRVLLADEPTSSLDVSVQRTVLDLVAGLSRDAGVATLLITHDLSVVHAVCDEVVVLRAGEVVETAPADRFFTAPAHPYSRRLLAAVPRLEASP
ncbi:MAG: ATP-binding cassette domain-containing protein [Propionicimonas sp.]